MKLPKLLSLYPICDLLRETPMSFTLAYKINKLIAILDENAPFYNASMKQIIDDYAEKDENGNCIKSDDGNYCIRTDAIDQCTAATKDLYSIEVEVPIRFSAADLEKIEVTPEQLEPLMELID